MFRTLEQYKSNVHAVRKPQVAFGGGYPPGPGEQAVTAPPGYPMQHQQPQYMPASQPAYGAVGMDPSFQAAMPPAPLSLPPPGVFGAAAAVDPSVPAERCVLCCIIFTASRE